MDALHQHWFRCTVLFCLASMTCMLEGGRICEVWCEAHPLTACHESTCTIHCHMCCHMYDLRCHHKSLLYSMQELAVMVARSRNDEIKAFPVVETIHKDNICHTTEAPARIPASVQLKAQHVAQQAVACLEGTVCRFHAAYSMQYTSKVCPCL